MQDWEVGLIEKRNIFTHTFWQSTVEIFFLNILSSHLPEISSDRTLWNESVLCVQNYSGKISRLYNTCELACNTCRVRDLWKDFPIFSPFFSTSYQKMKSFWLFCFFHSIFFFPESSFNWKFRFNDIEFEYKVSIIQCSTKCW